jgi:hypothetical protein
MSELDPYDAVLALPNLTSASWKTPGPGNTAKPFKVGRAGDEGLSVQTSRGGRVPLRPEAFQAAVKALDDLGAVLEERWVPISDESLQAILSGENREHACSSYVLPLLEAAGLIELDRSRPVKARTKRQG